jgi:hypothetical protein
MVVDDEPSILKLFKVLVEPMGFGGRSTNPAGGDWLDQGLTGGCRESNRQANRLDDRGGIWTVGGADGIATRW